MKRVDSALLPLAAGAGSCAAGAVVATRPQLSALVVVGSGAAVAWRAPLLAAPLVLSLYVLPTTGAFVHLGDDPQRRVALVVLATIAALSALRLPAMHGSARTLLSLCGLAVGAVAVQAVVLESANVARRASDVLVASAVLLVLAGRPRAHPHVRAAVRGILVVMAVQATLGAAQFVAGQPLLVGGALSAQNLVEARNIGGYFRGLGTFYHANSLALSLVLSLPLAQWLVRTASGPGEALFGRACLAVMALGVATTLSRAGILVGLLVLLWPSLARPGLQKLRVIAVAGGFALLGYVLVAHVPLLQRVAARFGGEQGSRDQGSALARASNLEGAVNAWADRPVVGFGFGRSAEVGVQYGGQRDLGAHNLYLDILVGGGVLLGLLSLAIAVCAARALSRDRDARQTVTGGLIAFLAYGLVESTAQGVFLLLVAVCLGVAVRRRDDSDEEELASQQSSTSSTSAASAASQESHAH